VNKNLTVSIITVGRSQLLEMVIHSLARNQKLPSFVDVIIDSETDFETQHVCEQFAEIYDDAFRWFAIKNSGVAAARNHAISLCRTQFIRLHDDDDIISFESILELGKRHEENPNGVFLTHTRLHEKFTRPFTDFLTKTPGYVFKYSGIPENKALTFDMFWGGRVSMPIKLFETESFEEDLKFGAEDIEFAYRALNMPFVLSYLPDIEAVQLRDFDSNSFALRTVHQGFSQAYIAQKYPRGRLHDWATIGIDRNLQLDLEEQVFYLKNLILESKRQDRMREGKPTMFRRNTKNYSLSIWHALYNWSKNLGYYAYCQGVSRDSLMEILEH
jgi:glycosyltransferase involved in cell wall biosynthesis